MVFTVILCQFVFDAVKAEFAFGDAISIAAYQGTEICPIRDIILKCVVACNDICEIALAVGNIKLCYNASEVDYFGL